MNAAERAARRHIAADWWIVPLKPRSKDPSGALVKHGHKDATNDVGTLAGWFRAFPEIGIATALEPSNLFVIGPDCPARLAEFEQRGMAHTAVAESREGHRLYFFKRPADCPIYRLCRPGEYDILTGGMAVLPPSIHPETGEERRWLVPPWEFDELPEAPAWAVAMLEEAVITTVPLPPASVAVDGDQAEPPVRLNDYDVEVWQGRHPARKPHAPDEVDRSETLWGMGMMLARANAGQVAIATALAERDRTLGLNAYSTRRDGGRLEYWRIACKAVDRVEREQAAAPAGSGDTSCPEQLAAARRQIAELQASLANVRAEYGRLHDDMVARHLYWTDPNIDPAVKVVGYAMGNIIAAAPHQPHRIDDAPRTAADPVRLPDYGIGRCTGQGRSTIWRALDEIDQRLGTIKLDTRPRPDGKSARYATLRDPTVPLALPAILERLRVDAAANPVPEAERHGGRRVCPECGRKHVRKIKTTHTYQCQDCGWQETVDEPAAQPCPPAAAPEPPLVFQDETPKDVERDGDGEPLVFQDETQAPAPTPLFTPAPAIRATDRRQNLRTLRPSTGAERERPHCQADGCAEFAADGSAYCAGHTAWEWADQADAEPPPAEPEAWTPPPQPHAHLWRQDGKRVHTPQGPGILRQAFAAYASVTLDSDPGRLTRFPPAEVQVIETGGANAAD